MTTSNLITSSASTRVDGDSPRRAWQLIAVEREVLYVLDSPPAPAEHLLLACRRKESELFVLFAGLSPDDARELQLRLSLPRPEDPIATGFVRLGAARRDRLLAFLADAGRVRAIEHHD